MAMFNSYLELPEGTLYPHSPGQLQLRRAVEEGSSALWWDVFSRAAAKFGDLRYNLICMQPGTALAAGSAFVWEVSGLMICKQLHVHFLLVIGCMGINIYINYRKSMTSSFTSLQKNHQKVALRFRSCKSHSHAVLPTQAPNTCLRRCL